MRVQIVGKQVVNFDNTETGQKIQGVKLYVVGKNDNVDGFCASKIWIDSTKTGLYQKAQALSFANGSLDCELDYQMQIGQTKAVLCDIRVLNQKA